MLWSDERKFLLFGTDGIKCVWRPVGTRNDPKYQLPTVKHGGEWSGVWGLVWSAKGMGPLRRIETTMDQHLYIDIMKNTMNPY